MNSTAIKINLNKNKGEKKAPDALNKNSVKHTEKKKASYAKFINNCSPCPLASGVEKHIVWFGAIVASGCKVLPLSANLTWKPPEETQGSQDRTFY